MRSTWPLTVARRVSCADHRRHATDDALSELELPGSAVAVLTGEGALLGARASGVATLPEATLRRAGAEPASIPIDGDTVRMRALDHARRGYALRLVVWQSLSPFEVERATVMRTLWVAMPVGLLLAAVGGWVIGWRLLAPLSGMVRQANTIDDRRLDGRLVVPRTGDELSALANAFNYLLERLAVAFQAQRRFMADASHQLRTPLSIARTAAQVTLAKENRSAAEYRESLGTVARQTERLTRMVDDMFDLGTRRSRRSTLAARRGLSRRDCQRVRLVRARSGGRPRGQRSGPDTDRPADAGRPEPVAPDDSQSRRECRPAHARARIGTGGCRGRCGPRRNRRLRYGPRYSRVRPRANLRTVRQARRERIRRRRAWSSDRAMGCAAASRDAGARIDRSWREPLRGGATAAVMGRKRSR